MSSKTAMHYDEQEESMGARIEKIKNGFLSHTHHSKNGKYNRQTTYHRSDPAKRLASIMQNFKQMHGKSSR